jgi:hypothetical protein
MDQQHQEIIEQLQFKLAARETLLFPMTTIVETGNHVGQRGDGRQRRQTAERFTVQVQKALEGTSPFIPTRMLSREALLEWLHEFPDWVMKNDSKGKGSGLGDLAIKKDFEYQCALHRARRVYIWSLDERLSGYDRPGIM